MIVDADFSLCTHVICSDTYMQSTKDSEWTEDQQKQYEECVNLRTTHPHLKVLYSVKYSPNEYYEMAGDLKKRRAFITRVFNIVSGNNFDGLNLIWQHSSESYPMDANMLLDENIPSLVKELKHTFKLNDLMFFGTFAKRIVAVLPKNMLTGTTEWRGDVQLLKVYDMVSISNDVDYVVIESFHTDEIEHLIKLDVPSDKLILKIPLLRSQIVNETETLIPIKTEYIESTIKSATGLCFPQIGGALVDVLFGNSNETELQTITRTLDYRRHPYAVNWIFMSFYDIKKDHIETNKKNTLEVSELGEEKKSIIGNVYKYIA
ncbi:chitinase-like protein 3 [Sitodiplosis mosellana]|uniref:chitinase-like protein 3 n=1 Tax=Sitodiplosis mosellana TaxID=263140 RepID=UPI0024450691|nr:chitinase-like protein 3 [Sitodiplosis mosellana]